MAVPAATRSGGIHAPPWLGIYPNDHLVAATAAVGPARRMNRGRLGPHGRGGHTGGPHGRAGTPGVWSRRAAYYR